MLRRLVGLVASPSRVSFGCAPQQVTATRLSQNPLIAVDTSPSLGGNVNGPAVIRVPDGIDRPLGRYYMNFANHMDEFIRMAYADAITGPWQLRDRSEPISRHAIRDPRPPRRTPAAG